MRRHEIDRRRRHLFRCHHQVALILPIRIVGHDHELSFGEVTDHVIDRVELKCLRRFRDHGPVMLRPPEGGATAAVHLALLARIASGL